MATTWPIDRTRYAARFDRESAHGRAAPFRRGADELARCATRQTRDAFTGSISRLEHLGQHPERLESGVRLDVEDRR
jgi:hypothetical protein